MVCSLSRIPHSFEDYHVPLSSVVSPELIPRGLSLLNILSVLHGVAVGDRLLRAFEFHCKKINLAAECDKKRKETVMSLSKQ